MHVLRSEVYGHQYRLRGRHLQLGKQINPSRRPAGFDDPEVMEAINDIAKNPQNMAKYKNKPNVLKFYAEMGKVMGDKLEKMPDEPGNPAAARAAAARATGR